MMMNCRPSKKTQVWAQRRYVWRTRRRKLNEINVKERDIVNTSEKINENKPFWHPLSTKKDGYLTNLYKYWRKKIYRWMTNRSQKNFIQVLPTPTHKLSLSSSLHITSHHSHSHSHIPWLIRQKTTTNWLIIGDN